MLNALYDFLPVLLFFLAFKFYGIYVATVVGIVATALQVLITAVLKKRVDKKELITFFVFLIFGSMTLYFHNPIFVKWKPTVVFWIFSLILLLSHFIGQKPIIQRMMEGILEGKAVIPNLIWRRLSFAWIVFFAVMGGINIYIAYSFSTDVWVNFKFYGILGLVFAFSILQAICLLRYLPEGK